MSPSSDEQKWLKFTRNFNYLKQKFNDSLFQLLWKENELMIAYIAYISTFHTLEKANETLMLMLILMFILMLILLIMYVIRRFFLNKTEKGYFHILVHASNSDINVAFNVHRFIWAFIHFTRYYELTCVSCFHSVLLNQIKNMNILSGISFGYWILHFY